MEMTGEMYTCFFDRKPTNVREGQVNRQNGKHEFFFLMATIFLREKMQIELQISAILDEFLVVATETVEKPRHENIRLAYENTVFLFAFQKQNIAGIFRKIRPGLHQIQKLVKRRHF